MKHKISSLALLFHKYSLSVWIFLRSSWKSLEYRDDAHQLQQKRTILSNLLTRSLESSCHRDLIKNNTDKKFFFLSLSFSVILSFHSFSCPHAFSFSKYFFCFLSLSHTLSQRNLTFLFSITIKIQRYDDTQFKKCKDQKRKVLIGLCCSNFKVFSQEPTSFGLIISRYLCHTYADTLFNGAQTWK